MAKIKPLEWKQVGPYSFDAETAFVTYRARSDLNGSVCTFYLKSECVYIFEKDGASMEDAKQAAGLDWIERVGRCFLID